MKVSGTPYSGKYDFIQTQMDWPITHMVAPKEKALGCVQCHAKDGRLAGLPGIYMPGSGSNPLLDKLGWGLALLAGLILYAIVREILRLRAPRAKPTVPPPCRPIPSTSPRP